jgi:hypothetical protein
MRRLLVGALLVIILGACAESEDTSTAAQATTTTAPVLPDGACVARMSDPNPGQGGSETVIVDSHFAGQPVVVTAHYKSKDSTFSGNVDASKHEEVTFSIGQPTAGYPVTVDVVVGDPNATPPSGEKCQTSFTPH